MNERGYVLIQVSGVDILSNNTSRITDILNSYVPDNVELIRNRVRIEVLGYSNDKRELFDIPEVRKYFHHLFDEEPGLFYYFDMESYMFIFFALMLFKPYRHDGIVEVKLQDMQQYLNYGYLGLNQFCNIHNVSAQPTDKLIRKVFSSFNY